MGRIRLALRLLPLGLACAVAVLVPAAAQARPATGLRSDGARLTALGRSFEAASRRLAGRLGMIHPTFRPRVGHAMGLLPRLGTQPIDFASGQNIPVVYHGGHVMRNVTVHTIFWAPPGYHFDGPPTSGTLGYEALIKQFLVDVAHDSASPHNVFSTLTQYKDGHGAASSQINYDPASDSVDVNAPYPPAGQQCPSPAGVSTCVTDLQLEQEIDKVIGPNDSGARGLSNIWFVFLPPDVDTCILVGECATTAYAGYHSEFDLGHGPTIYVPVPDPLVEFTPPPGSDPQGNAEAELTLDTVAHEAEESITDPYGNAWMDPNGFEVADECENPEYGTPLGYAPDGSPYNQLINGHAYLIQDMWSNAVLGCVQGSSSTQSPLPLHTVSLHQYSPSVSGSLGVARGGVPVAVGLLRGLDLVAQARARTRANGSWGPVKLRSASGALHGVGDDREGVAVAYGPGGSAGADLIATGDGGDPFSESGYTGWFDLDTGFALGSHGVIIGPCSQTGVLSIRVGSSFTPSPSELCSTEADAAEIPTRFIGPGTAVTMTSQDNRAPSPIEAQGALVKMSLSLGEPDSIPVLGNDQVAFLGTGLPQCTALLRIRAVRCSGLVPGTRYRLGRRSAQAGLGGSFTVSGLRLHGGQALTLRNQARRRLTTLHVAHLRVAITGDQTRIASGTCQPGDFYGPPMTSPPNSPFVGAGAFGNGTICPGNGHARGLSTKDIAQTDDLSGGQTVVSVPFIESTAPLQDETLYGPFVASAQTGLPGPHNSTENTQTPVGLTITTAGSHHRVFHAANVDTARGRRVAGLAPGPYVAKWVLRDTNGDTRTVTTRFTDER
jgi:hypothetical protein